MAVRFGYVPYRNSVDVSMVVVRMWRPKETTIGGSNRMQFANAPSISFGFLAGLFENTVVGRTELVSFWLVCGHAYVYFGNPKNELFGGDHNKNDDANNVVRLKHIPCSWLHEYSVLTM